MCKGLMAVCGGFEGGKRAVQISPVSIGIMHGRKA